MPKFVKKHFDNPFQDYIYEPCYDNAEDDTKLKLYQEQTEQNSKIFTCIDEKWKNTLQKFKNLDPNDYSVYTGTSGIALLKLLKDPEDKNNLLEVKQLLGLNHLKGRRHTFLCGDAGPLAIGAVVSHKLGDVSDTKKLIDKLLSMNGPVLNCKSDLPNEYLYGRAGYLYALLYVNKHISPPPIEKNIIEKIIKAILICGKKFAETERFKSPLMYEWHDSCYLGAAHGLAGIIYLLLQVPEYLSHDDMLFFIRPTMNYLRTLRFPSGNYPSSLGSDSDKYVQWCHGAPGFLYMYAAAYRASEIWNYLQYALECGDIIWERGLLKKGYSLCHGVAGNAYCFLELYQLTKDPIHLHRAHKFAEWCANYSTYHEEHPPDRPLSLFEGIAGPMYLLIDLQKPKEAKFPGFTL